MVTVLLTLRNSQLLKRSLRIFWGSLLFRLFLLETNGKARLIISCSESREWKQPSKSRNPINLCNRLNGHKSQTGSISRVVMEVCSLVETFVSAAGQFSKAHWLTAVSCFRYAAVDERRVGEEGTFCREKSCPLVSYLPWSHQPAHGIIFSKHLDVKVKQLFSSRQKR